MEDVILMSLCLLLFVENLLLRPVFSLYSNVCFIGFYPNLSFTLSFSEPLTSLNLYYLLPLYVSRENQLIERDSLKILLPRSLHVESGPIYWKSPLKTYLDLRSHKSSSYHLQTGLPCLTLRTYSTKWDWLQV